MQPAPELLTLLARYYEASGASDADYLAAYMSHDPGALVVGTADEEWWRGGEQIIALWSNAWRSRGGLAVTGSNPQAFREGSVGWLSDQACWVRRDGSEIPFRITAVFHLEAGQWRCIQAHYSLGVPNS